MTRCTICGSARPLSEPGFGNHQRSEQHRLAVEKPPNRTPGPGSHHDWHIYLQIPCGCMETARRAA